MPKHYEISYANRFIALNKLTHEVNKAEASLGVERMSNEEHAATFNLVNDLRGKIKRQHMDLLHEFSDKLTARDARAAAAAAVVAEEQPPQAAVVEAATVEEAVAAVTDEAQPEAQPE